MDAYYKKYMTKYISSKMSQLSLMVINQLIISSWKKFPLIVAWNEIHSEVDGF